MAWWRRDRTLERQTTTLTMSALTEAFWAATYSGGPIPERTGAAARCLQIASQSLGSVDLRFAGNFRPAWVDSPAPDWYNGIGEALSAATYSLYRHGDALLWVTSRYDTGYPRTWTVLDPTAVKIWQDAGGRRRYRAGDRELNPADVVQIPYKPGPGLRGWGALQAAAASITTATASEDFATKMFTKGAMPHAVLRSTQRRLEERQAIALQNQWVEATSRRDGAPPVLPPDIDFEKMSWSPKETMLLELREFDTRAICAAFGVPSILLGVPATGGLTYQSPGQLLGIYWSTELRSIAKRMETALTARLLPRGNLVRFDPTDFVGADAQTWLKGLELGAVSVDEVRAALFGLPPIERGDGLAALSEPAGTATSPKLAAVT